MSDAQFEIGYGIIIEEAGEAISEALTVYECFNDFFISVVSEIGYDTMLLLWLILFIKVKLIERSKYKEKLYKWYEKFSFQSGDADTVIVDVMIKKLPQKAAGHIPGEMIDVPHRELATHLSNLTGTGHNGKYLLFYCCHSLCE